MSAGSPLPRLVLWNVRAGLRLLCWFTASVGQTMVALAAAFNACRRAGVSLGVFVIPAQLALLLAWAPTRVLFLALLGAAKGVYRTDSRLRGRWGASAALDV